MDGVWTLRYTHTCANMMMGYISCFLIIFLLIFYIKKFVATCNCLGRILNIGVICCRWRWIQNLRFNGENGPQM
jgi:hypothetical protein